MPREAPVLYLVTIAKVLKVGLAVLSGQTTMHGNNVRTVQYRRTQMHSRDHTLPLNQLGPLSQATRRKVGRKRMARMHCQEPDEGKRRFMLH